MRTAVPDGPGPADGVRDLLRSAVAQRLARAENNTSLSSVLDPEAATEAGRLAADILPDDGDLDSRLLLAGFHGYRYLALRPGRGEQEWQVAIDWLASVFASTAYTAPLPEQLHVLVADRVYDVAADITVPSDLPSFGTDALTAAARLWQQILAATPDHHPGRAGRLGSFGLILAARFERTGAPADLDRAVDVGRRAVQATTSGHHDRMVWQKDSPADYTDRAIWLNALGNALRTRSQRTATPADLDEAVDVCRRAVQATVPDDPGRGACLITLGAALQARFVHIDTPMDLYEAIEVGRRAVLATAAEDPERAVALNNLGNAFRIRFEWMGAPADLDDAVETGRSAVDAAPAGHWHRARCLKNLALALQTRFELTGVVADLDESVETHRLEVEALPAGHPDRAKLLNDLGIAFLQRFERTGAPEPLDDAVEMSRAAVGCTEDGRPEQAEYLITLGNTLRARFERTGSRTDLDEAVATDRRALSVAPTTPARSTIMNNLGITLQHLFRQTGRMDHLDEAVEIGRAALRETPAGDPGLAMRSSNLGSALLLRFERTGLPADLDEAVELGRRAMQTHPLGDTEQSIFLNGLGSALRARYKWAGVPADVHEAVEVSRRSLQATPTNHPNRVKYLTTLGISLQNMARQTGGKPELDEAVEIGRQAVQAASAGQADRAVCLSNLGNALLLRFDRTGAPADLDEAVEVCRAAVQATPEDSPNRILRLNNLANALMSRFEWTGALADVNEVVALRRRALQLTPVDDPKLALCLNNLGSALWLRFDRIGAAADQDEAVDACRQAVQATPAGNSVLADRLTNLGAVLLSRFERTGAATDIAEAVDVCRRALQVTTPEATFDRAAKLSTLGSALLLRFQQTGAVSDVYEAVEVCRQAVQARPPDHPGRARLLFVLGQALLVRAGHSPATTELAEAAVPLQDLDEAAAAWQEAAQSPVAPPSIRIQSARNAALLLWSAKGAPALMRALSLARLSRKPTGLRNRRRRAAEMVCGAVRLLPEVAPRRLQRPDQQYALGEYAELAADAAALTLRDTSAPAAERAALALQMLEAGRAVLLGQALQVRNDTGELEQQHPGLAAEFIRLRGLLDYTPTNPLDTDMEPTIDTRHRLAREFDEVLARIRAEPGFETFALPPAIAQLLEQAADGPIVIFNISSYGSDALLLTASGVKVLPMRGLTRETVLDRVTAFRAALTDAGHGATATDRRAAQQRLVEILEWLWDNATGPVLDALGYRRPVAVGRAGPRVWWIPGGLLGQLPIHAAGHHTDPSRRRGGVRTVMDRVVSSYTPTVTALRHARRRATGVGSEPATSRPALVVAMPTTPGVPGRLHHVLAEAGMLTTRLPGAITLTEPETSLNAVPGHTDALSAPAGSPKSTPATTGADDVRLPTRDRVLQLLRECSIAHFACHGVSDNADPSRSRLLLHDHATAPFTVAALAPLDLGHARLAYLSACETAATSVELIDEAIHLTSAFQLAGYPQVIGTLWTVDDETATQIAESFYTALFDSDSAIPDTDRAAHALHDAVRAVRDTFRATPSLWAAHLHAGA
ncbi:CHAT domain-containing protein [Nocardia carnea]|uniref:CHAT domain-containing protein n=1 Tax=Nocardia carnea TaxID=37328 RepID=UPI0024542E7D|nr:CHAT domain-containing protein [Nocardia carnea]